jgi:hypothetical protein
VAIVDHVGVVQVITASEPEWIAPFTGLEPGQFGKLIRLVAKRGGEQDRGRAPGPAVGVATGRPCAAGGDLLADEPDDAPDRAVVVRGVAFRGTG